MFDLELVQQLHALQIDPAASPEEQQEARDKIAAITDEVVEQYLASLVLEADAGFGRKRGARRFESYEVLWARNCLEDPIIGKDGRKETNPPAEDRVGNVLYHRKYSRRSE